MEYQFSSLSDILTPLDNDSKMLKISVILLKSHQVFICEHLKGALTGLTIVNPNFSQIVFSFRNLLGRQ
jgi:hypothetical protein